MGGLPWGVAAGGIMRPSTEQAQGQRIADATSAQANQQIDPTMVNWNNAIGGMQANALDYLKAAQAGDTVAQHQLQQGQQQGQHNLNAGGALGGVAGQMAAGLGSAQMQGQGIASAAALKAQETQNAYQNYIGANMGAGQQYAMGADVKQGVNDMAQNFGLQNQQIAQNSANQNFGQTMSSAAGLAGGLAGAWGAGLSGSDERVKILADRLYRGR